MTAVMVVSDVTEMTKVMAIIVGFKCWVGHSKDVGMLGYFCCFGGFCLLLFFYFYFYFLLVAWT